MSETVEPFESRSCANLFSIRTVGRRYYLRVRAALCSLYGVAYGSMPEYAYQDPGDVQAYVDRLYEGDPSGFFIVERDGAVLGFLAMHVASCVPAEQGLAAELQEVVVDPRWQKRGIGTALFSRGKEHARQQGCKMIGLWVGEKNRRAIALYKRMGFSRKGQTRCWVRMELSI